MSKEKFVPKWEGSCDGCREFGILHEHTYEGEYELLCNHCLSILG